MSRPLHDNQFNSVEIQTWNIRIFDKNNLDQTIQKLKEILSGKSPSVSKNEHEHSFLSCCLYLAQIRQSNHQKIKDKQSSEKLKSNLQEIKKQVADFDQKLEASLLILLLDATENPKIQAPDSDCDFDFEERKTHYFQNLLSFTKGIFPYIKPDPTFIAIFYNIQAVLYFNLYSASKQENPSQEEKKRTRKLFNNALNKLDQASKYSKNLEFMTQSFITLNYVAILLDRSKALFDEAASLDKTHYLPKANFLSLESETYLTKAESYSVEAERLISQQKKENEEKFSVNEQIFMRNKTIPTLQFDISNFFIGIYITKTLILKEEESREKNENLILKYGQKAIEIKNNHSLEISPETLCAIHQAMATSCPRDNERKKIHYDAAKKISLTAAEDYFRKTMNKENKDQESNLNLCEKYYILFLNYHTIFASLLSADGSVSMFKPMARAYLNLAYITSKKKNKEKFTYYITLAIEKYSIVNSILEEENRLLYLKTLYDLSLCFRTQGNYFLEIGDFKNAAESFGIMAEKLNLILKNKQEIIEKKYQLKLKKIENSLSYAKKEKERAEKLSENKENSSPSNKEDSINKIMQDIKNDAVEIFCGVSQPNTTPYLTKLLMHYYYIIEQIASDNDSDFKDNFCLKTLYSFIQCFHIHGHFLLKNGDFENASTLFSGMTLMATKISQEGKACIKKSGLDFARIDQLLVIAKGLKEIADSCSFNKDRISVEIPCNFIPNYKKNGKRKGEEDILSILKGIRSGCQNFLLKCPNLFPKEQVEEQTEEKLKTPHSPHLFSQNNSQYNKNKNEKIPPKNSATATQYSL